MDQNIGQLTYFIATNGCHWLWSQWYCNINLLTKTWPRCISCYSNVLIPSRQLTVHWQPTMLNFHKESDFHLQQSQYCLLGNLKYTSKMTMLPCYDHDLSKVWHRIHGQVYECMVVLQTSLWSHELIMWCISVLHWSCQLFAPLEKGSCY